MITPQLQACHSFGTTTAILKRLFTKLRSVSGILLPLYKFSKLLVKNANKGENYNLHLVNYLQKRNYAS